MSDTSVIPVEQQLDEARRLVALLLRRLGPEPVRFTQEEIDAISGEGVVIVWRDLMSDKLVVELRTAPEEASV